MQLFCNDCALYKSKFCYFCIIDNHYDALNLALLLRKAIIIEPHLARSTVKLSLFLD